MAKKILIIFTSLLITLIFIGIAVFYCDDKLYLYEANKKSLLRSEYLDSLKQYDIAIKLNPNNAEAYLLRGDARYWTSNYESAIKDYDKVISLDPNNAEAYWGRGDAKNALGLYNQSLQDYNTVLDLIPSYAKASKDRSNDVEYTLRIFREIRLHDKKLRFCPEDANTYLSRGREKLKFGLYNEAIQDFNEVIRIDPNVDGSFKGKRNLKDGLRKPYEKKLVCTYISTEYSPAAYAYVQRAFAKNHLSNYEDAMKDLDKIISMYPDYDFAYIVRGNIKKSVGIYNEAILDYDKAINSRPYNTEAYIRRGEVKKILGDYNAADSDFSKAIDLDSRAIEAYLLRAELYESQGLRNEAAKNYDRAYMFASTDYSNPHYDLLARAEFGLRDYKSAMENFDNAIKLNPNNAELYVHRGLAKGILGISADAMKDLDKALELNPNLMDAHGAKFVVSLLAYTK